MNGVTSKRGQPTRGPLLRRAGTAMFWGGVLVLGAFGTYFTFANYPLFAAGVVLVLLLLTVYSERKRRRELRAWESARRRDRIRSIEPLERLDAPTRSRRDATTMRP
jgi:hypothetical protein